MKFTPYEIKSYLHDKRRTNLFIKAINKVVKPGDVVLEIGGGTGILSLAAARAGASKVYCVEINERFCNMIKRHAEQNGFGDIIEVIHRDAVIDLLPIDRNSVDVYISELLSTGMFIEPHVQAYNNCVKYCKSTCSYIPDGVSLHFDFAHITRTIYEFDMSSDSYSGDSFIAKHMNCQSAGSNKTVTYKELFFRGKVVSDNIKSTFKTTFTGGKHIKPVNAFYITSSATLADGCILNPNMCDTLFVPEVIFLPKEKEFVGNVNKTVTLEYFAGTDPINISITIE